MSEDPMPTGRSSCYATRPHPADPSRAQYRALFYIEDEDGNVMVWSRGEWVDTPPETSHGACPPGLD